MRAALRKLARLTGEIVWIDALVRLKFYTFLRVHMGSARLKALDAQEIERALQELVARGQRAWPQLAVAPEEWVRHAARHLAESTDARDLLTSLSRFHAEDLYLACACTLGVPGAFDAFDRSFLGPGLPRLLSRYNPSPDFVDEVRQALREKLLMTTSGNPPRITEYSGRGALANWVRVAALRTALDLRRREGGEPAAAKRDAELAAASTTPDLRYIKVRYGKEFQAAVTAAFATLNDEQCNLLRLQHVDGLRTAQIATLFHVDRSTIKRRLAACRAQMLDETRRILRERLGMSTLEFESLSGLIQSQLHLSVERLLRTREQ